MKGKLLLFPSTLGDSPPFKTLPYGQLHLLPSIRFYIVEDVRSARRFIRKAIPEMSIDELSFSLLNEHTMPAEISPLLDPARNGHDVALLSEAGLPCVADPGAALVELAHEEGIRVVPLIGPSSIFLALMASGMNGQKFAFHGYLPVDKREKIQRIKFLELDVYQKNQTQIFIETPYRNNQLLEVLVETCKPETRICIAVNLTLEDEFIISQTKEKWRKSSLPDIHKKPAVFLIYR